jgi:nicotinate-nucleotide pyrophosphorylase (carboxylating)
VNDQELIKAALAEDLAGGVDITSQATITADATATADFIARTLRSTSQQAPRR